MKYRIVLLLTVFSILVQLLSAQNFTAQLNTLLNDKILVDSDVSLAIYDITADTMLFTHRNKKLCRPASVAKVVTATVALERLGCDYTINTALFSFDNATGGKNLYIKGEIDPLFSVENLDSMLSVLPSGVSVDTLFADCTFMDSIYWGPGWSWDDTPWEFQPYISPLMLNGGCVEVKATPSSKGNAPLVECFPESSFYTIVNEAVSNVNRGEKFTILRDWLDNSNIIRLRGDCNAVKSEKMNLFPSQEYFLTVMREQLAKRYISVAYIGYAPVPENALELFVMHRTITDVIVEALMESNNLCAESLSYHLGALYGKFPVAQEMGCKLMEGYLDSILDMPENYNIADGSGLSLYTYLSSDIIIQVLRRAYSNKNIRDIVMKGLPLSGVSGTMKHRCKNSVAYKRVRAKTGTVKGVCTLAGYAKTENNHTLAFVILNQNSMSARNIRIWQDKVCDVICRYR